MLRTYKSIYYDFFDNDDDVLDNILLTLESFNMNLYKLL
jgi:hypothetical protein